MSNITNNWNEYNPGNLVPKYIVNRFDNKKDRFYYFKDEGKELRCGAGITTWLSKVMPESPFLTDWKIKWGKDWKIVLDLTSDAGTMLHACLGYMMINNQHPEQIMIDACKGILKELRKYDKSCSEDMIDKAIISFQKFRDDYNLKPLLIEAQLVCQSNMNFYCMTMDLLAEVTYDKKTKVEVQDGQYVRGDKKGQPKFVTETKSELVTEIVAIDFKSNFLGNKESKGFFDTHKYQLIGTAKAVSQNFGIKVDRLFNWSNDNWRTNVGDYTLHEWKITPNDIDIFNTYESLGAKLGAFTPAGNIQVFKNWEPGMKAEEMIKSYSYLDYVASLEEEKI